MHGETLFFFYLVNSEMFILHDASVSQSDGARRALAATQMGPFIYESELLDLGSVNPQDEDEPLAAAGWKSAPLAP